MRIRIGVRPTASGVFLSRRKTASRAQDAPPAAVPVRRSERLAEVVLGVDELVAGLGRRLAARLIDVAARGMLFYVSLVLALMVSMPAGALFALSGEEAAIAFLLISAICLLLLIYEPCALAWKGRTFGKRLTGIEVRQSDNLHQVPTIAQALKRYVFPATLGGVLVVLAWEIASSLWPGQSISGDMSLFEYILRNEYLEDDPDPVLWFVVWLALLGPIVGLPLGAAFLALARRALLGSRVAWHDSIAGTVVVRVRVSARGGQPTARLAAPESLGVRWRRFTGELLDDQIRQYEADADAQAHRRKLHD